MNNQLANWSFDKSPPEKATPQYNAAAGEFHPKTGPARRKIIDRWSSKPRAEMEAKMGKEARDPRRY